MDVNQTSAITTLNPDTKKSPDHRDPENHDAPGDEQHPGDSGSWRNLDAVEVDSVLFDGVTPEVQIAINSLTCQIEPLRAELERTRGREQQLRELAGQHVFLDVPCRREFMRELGHVLSHCERNTITPAVIIFHIRNADDVRIKAGRDALDQLLASVVQVVSENLDPAAMLGSLGGNDFGVILLSCDGESAGATAALIRDCVSRPGFSWQGQKFEIEVALGLHVAARGDSAEAVINAADNDLRARQPIVP